MKDIKMPSLRIGNMLIEKPIIQGGMGVGVSLSGLAAAVANEGGVGVIASVGMAWINPGIKKDPGKAGRIALISEIREARKRTNGILGLNIMVALSDYNELLETAFDEDIDIVFLGAGLPLKFPASISPDRLKKGHTKVAVIVSSARAADLIFRQWRKSFQHIPDMVVVEGPLAGGHLGFKKEQIDHPDYTLEKILPEVIKTVAPYQAEFRRNIPVIAAGGIFTGKDIYKFLEMGAQGVQMGTRFVATHECDASAAFKNAYIHCRKNDISIIKSPVGLPGRAIINAFLKKVASGEKKPVHCPWQCLKSCNFKISPYCIAQALINAQKGFLERGFTFAGANAYRIKKIVPVRDLFITLNNEYKKAVLSAAV